MAREAEVRLEASFETASASKLERYIKNRPGLSYMIGMETPLELTSQLGDVFLAVVRHAEDAGWSEVQTRDALAAAWNVVGYYYLWRGDPVLPIPDVQPIPPADTKMRDLPPALAGYSIAEQHLIFNAALQDRATYQNTVESKIANVWIGDGKSVEELKPSRTEQRMTGRQRAKIEAGRDLIGETEMTPLPTEGKIKSEPPLWHRVLMEREAERQADKQSR